MKVGAAIYSMLKDDSAVSALVGTRIYPELAEEGAATPYVVYSVVSNTPVDTKDSAPVDEAQLEVFSVADTYAAANDLADKVRAALARQEKVVYDTVTVQSIKYTNEVTEVSAERNLFISVQDYTARTVSVIARPSFLFDSYGGALGAYSLRQLNVNYTGAAVTVRRESDNATKDIGFDVYGNLQQGELEAFCAGTNGFVSVWKDQSGNGNDATQTTLGDQPQIVDNGACILANGKPAMHWVNSTLNANDLIGQSRLDVYVTYKTSDTNYILFASQDVNGRYSAVVQASSSSTLLSYDWTQVGELPTIYQNGTQVAIDQTTTRDDLVALLVDGALNLEVNENVRTDEWTAFGISKYEGGRWMDGYMTELVVYNSDQSANRTGIESNIMTHYSIT
jgi:hypothetical protein